MKMVATGFALYDHVKNKSKLKIIENMCMRVHVYKLVAIVYTCTI